MSLPLWIVVYFFLPASRRKFQLSHEETTKFSMPSRKNFNISLICGKLFSNLQWFLLSCDFLFRSPGDVIGQTFLDESSDSIGFFRFAQDSTFVSKILEQTFEDFRIIFTASLNRLNHFFKNADEIFFGDSEIESIGLIYLLSFKKKLFSFPLPRNGGRAVCAALDRWRHRRGRDFPRSEFRSIHRACFECFVWLSSLTNWWPSMID